MSPIAVNMAPGAMISSDIILPLIRQTGFEEIPNSLAEVRDVVPDSLALTGVDAHYEANPDAHC